MQPCAVIVLDRDLGIYMKTVMSSSDTNPVAESIVASTSPEASENPSSRRPPLVRRCAIDAPKEEQSSVKNHVRKRRSTIDVAQDRSSGQKIKKRKIAAGERIVSTNPDDNVASSKFSRPPVKDPSSSTDKKEKLVVYSIHHRHKQQGVGNVEFRKDLDPETTPQSRVAVVDRILHRYRFYKMDLLAARLKIVKAVSEKRGFYEKLTTEVDRIKFAFLEPFKRQGSHLPGFRFSRTPIPTESQYLHEFSKSSAYIEELAFHHYKQFTNDDDDLDRLEPLPPPPSEIPLPPRHGSIAWNYNAETRVYLGDFTTVSVIPHDQKMFLGSLMERDDITVICEGLYDKVIDVKQFLHSLGCCFGKTPYGKFRQFMRRQSHETGFTDYEEKDGYIAMDVKEKYLNYLARNAYGGSDFDTCTFDLQTPIDTKTMVESDAIVSTVLAAGANTGEKTDTTDPLDDISQDRSIYMTDVEIASRFPRFDREYKEKFKMKEILPAGKWCLMSHVCDFLWCYLGPLFPRLCV
jgi:hypothetical protein